MNKEKKKKRKKQKPVTTEFGYQLKRNPEYTDEEKLQFSIALLPVMERVITGHMANILKEFKTDKAPDQLYLMKEFCSMADILKDYMDRINKIMNYSLKQILKEYIKNKKND